MGTAVKGLLIASVGLYLIQLAGERWLNIPVSYLLGFNALQLLKGWFWQPFTYAFLHAGIFHLVFNLLIVWSIGSELEQAWGSRFFLMYFFACTIQSAADSEGRGDHLVDLRGLRNRRRSGYLARRLVGRGLRDAARVWYPLRR